MTNAGNVISSPGVLRVGLIAQPEHVSRLRPALAGCPWLNVVIQSGPEPSAALAGVTWADDPRAVLNKDAVEAILLADTTRANVALTNAALDDELPIWRLPPLGRTFAEAAELMARARRGGTVWRVASSWEFVSEQAWNELHWPGDFTPHYSEVRLSATGPDPRAWHASAAHAAGGALAEAGYAALEALVGVRGLPESVAASTAAAPRGGPQRETEDIAVGILRYRAGGIALVRATWDIGPPEDSTLHVGTGLNVQLGGGEVRLSDPQGRRLDQRPIPSDWLTVELSRFAEQVRSAARDRAAAPLDRHLAVSALLEAIYLSARTGQPESPRRLYEVQGLPIPE